MRLYVECLAQNLEYNRQTGSVNFLFYKSNLSFYLVAPVICLQEWISGRFEAHSCLGIVHLGI